MITSTGSLRPWFMASITLSVWAAVMARYLTYVEVGLGATELNPFMGFLLWSPLLLSLASAATLVAFYTVAWAVARSGRFATAARVMLVLFPLLLLNDFLHDFLLLVGVNIP